MACPKLLYNHDQESSPFLGVWKKERLENVDAHFLGTPGEKSRAENFCDSYLPFGLTFNSWHVSPKNHYQFQGQEHQPELGWDQFKWRNADPALGRFFNIDPLSEEFYYNSPYAFSENAVTSHIELEGLEKLSIHVLGQVKNNQGGQTTFANKTVVDYGNNNQVNFVSGTSSSDKVIAGQVSNDMSYLVETSNPGFVNSVQEEMSNPGIKVNDALAKVAIDGADLPGNLSLKGARHLVGDLGSEELNNAVQSFFSATTRLIDEGLVDLYIGYDGSETTSVDKNGNSTERKFTTEATLQSQPISIVVGDQTYSFTIQATYTNEETENEEE